MSFSTQIEQFCTLRVHLGNVSPEEQQFTSSVPLFDSVLLCIFEILKARGVIFHQNVHFFMCGGLLWSAYAEIYRVHIHVIFAVRTCSLFTAKINSSFSIVGLKICFRNQLQFNL